ncbi:cytochrome c3 family protein [Arenibacter certesii]|uniref:cytochrome c3 family protein n=1 Tax=Arenibacter certesii TaxID=228955 RepID=UPI000421B769|nr:cytochrome c3 family protein [Arenibacter certesii]
MKKRLGIISLFVIIFIAFIVIWNYSYKQSFEEAYISVIESPTGNYIPAESGAFRRLEDAHLDYSKMPIDENHQRSLEEYYDNRAYPGAPPSIPHPVAKEMSYGANTCNQCHQNGGFVEKFNAYAPITPHPEMVNCRQCHVAIISNSTFKEFAYSKPEPPKVGVGVNNALLDGPPMIPHQLQMRENCVTCHAGPSAPKEIRVSHPERVNCRQCHLPMDSKKIDGDITTFIRQFNTSNEE